MRQVRRTENRKVPTSAGRKAAGRRETAAGYGFLVPWLIGFLGLTVGPMIFSLYLAFTKYNLFTEPEWIGLDNFVRMFTEDPNFIQSVQITLDLRAGRHSDQAGRGARRRDAAELPRPGHRASSAPRSTPRR